MSSKSRLFGSDDAGDDKPATPPPASSSSSSSSSEASKSEDKGESLKPTDARGIPIGEPENARRNVVATDAPEREKWGATPPLSELEQSSVLEVRTSDPKSVGLFVAGVHALPTAQQVQTSTITARGAQFLSTLASDPQVEVRIVS